MNVDSTISRIRHPDAVDDLPTSVLRDGARRLLAQAIEAEADAFLAMMREERLDDGRARFVRHGHGPERVIQPFFNLRGDRPGAGQADEGTRSRR